MTRHRSPSYPVHAGALLLASSLFVHGAGSVAVAPKLVPGTATTRLRLLSSEGVPASGPAALSASRATPMPLYRPLQGFGRGLDRDGSASAIGDGTNGTEIDGRAGVSSGGNGGGAVLAPTAEPSPRAKGASPLFGGEDMGKLQGEDEFGKDYPVDDNPGQQKKSS
mmetsp:Transcript_45716/g.126871  ORF Transcript_45716/g.126871 Transcript_45716/m.126871 type:complete len:166 (+) Transcript_45716:119-616(+)|eukprot:CAMPEP_0117581838 /NCGR_PEP_ID=MMETSP0784-20121206/66074_1 /TAXON_ID=39447 /ORGANISM="" /LENGTH=165 /DNA_ID=CAMNT_0005382243 /DNA_START=119 /DNA_END=616 /DNA_ORIENTATION=-